MKKILSILCFIFSLTTKAHAMDLNILDLHLYSGDKYLGCLTCNKHESESICNKFGRYGSDFNTDSIWNTFGTYGNEYNQISPWNEFSAHEDVPVIADDKGEFYGYFTINEHRNFAMENAGEINKIYKQYKRDLAKVRDFICN